ncbi:unnamed protein product [Gordionus sp. m RMFG-2023]
MFSYYNIFGKKEPIDHKESKHTKKQDKSGEIKKEDKKPKACCSCPETKEARDSCILKKGEENCKDLIAAHKECMKKLGFNI